MKIWTITTDHEGTQTAGHCTKEAAEAQAVEIVTAWYDRHLRGDTERRDHTDWRESYAMLCDTVGFLECLTMEEHDISDHPAIAAAIEATALAETVIGKLANGDLNLHTDQSAIMDAYDAVADANCLLRGVMAPDEPTFGISPDLQAAMEAHESAYREAAKEHATDDLEFDDEPAVVFGDDDGAFVSCWLWVSQTELPKHLQPKSEEFLQ